MELLEILKCSEGYAGQNRNIPPEWKARAQKLCWEYNQTAPDQGGGGGRPSCKNCWGPAIRRPLSNPPFTAITASISTPTV